MHAESGLIVLETAVSGRAAQAVLTEEILDLLGETVDGKLVRCRVAGHWAYRRPEPSQ